MLLPLVLLLQVSIQVMLRNFIALFSEPTDYAILCYTFANKVVTGHAVSVQLVDEGLKLG